MHPHYQNAADAITAPAEVQRTKNLIEEFFPMGRTIRTQTITSKESAPATPIPSSVSFNLRPAERWTSSRCSGGRTAG